MSETDAIGKAIWDYYKQNDPEIIVVESDLTENDIMPIEHLFRTYENFSTLEKTAMEHCKGKILDVGTGAGPHAKYLIEKGFDVSTLEISPLAHQYLKEVLPEARHFTERILDFNTGKYDTILLLMNGIGLAGKFENITPFLKHISTLLSPSGSIICDSTDVQNVFEDEDGGLWIDLNANYYGEFKFNMKYKGTESGWFNWVYVDLKNLKQSAKDAGLSLTLLDEDENSFLVQLKKEI